MKKVKKTEEKWSPLGALEVVLVMTEGSNFECNDKVFNSALDYLSEKLSLTKKQVMLLAVLVNNDDRVSWHTIADHFKSTLIKALSYGPEMNELIKRRWVMRVCRNSPCNYYQAVPEVVEALSNDRIYVPRSLSGRTTQQFIDEVRAMFKTTGPLVIDLAKTESVMDLVNENPYLPICKLASQLTDHHSYGIFFKVVEDYFAYMGDEQHVGVCTELNEFNFEDLEFVEEHVLGDNLAEGCHELFNLGMVEHKCVDGLAMPEFIVLTDKSKEALAGYKLRKKGRSVVLPNGYVKHKTIKAKSLYYNDEDAKQMDMLTKLLSKDQFPKVQNRLSEQGFRKGVACLLHGYPGTGKTASVYEIARQTGRDIMPVDIASMRDKYVGETEKAISNIFRRYRDLCQSSTVTPILLFNEADALINKRLENAESSVDKMENSMQNIILQEMENLDGILIATTNLISNLDEAFDRRFLFKIELHKPDISVKSKIWKSMITDLSDNDATRLACKYDFSGGQIENIARKQSIEYVISGNHPTIDEIDYFCQKEILNPCCRVICT